ncbi:MAG: alpha-amylase family glycosyl hydrolase [Nitriliruptoraceae bacterium]
MPPPTVTAHSWLAGSVGYEIYVRSFADSDGDGLGDLAGVRSRLPYLADLGVEVIWLTPFYPSPQRDHGYDIADHLDVDPRFGDLAELGRLLSDAHELGLRVLIDLVPNHTSDQHPWFVDARSSRDAEHRSFYVWLPPGPDGGPPNNWVSHFGGPAWSYDEASGEYYLHLFLPEQPDLNWAEPRVWDAFDRIVTTWLDRGIDGVRIDVAHALVKDAELRDNPPRSQVADDATVGPTPQFDRFHHAYDLDQDGVIEVYRHWRPLADAHDAVLLGEVFLLDADRVDRYVADDALHAAFCFAALKVGWDADAIRRRLRPFVDASGDALAWPLSSHDDPRAATRFGGGELGARRAHAYLTLLCGLPGTVFLFQGDELGLDDGVLDEVPPQDPIARRNPGETGRDPQRTPMPWEPGEHLGFTSGEPWLPLGANRTEADTVAAQLGDPTSWLERTRRLLATRRSLTTLTDGSTTDWVIDDGPVIVIERGGEVLVCLHVGDGGGAAILELPSDCRLAYASADDVVLVEDHLTLPEDAAAIIELEPPEEQASISGMDEEERALIDAARQAADDLDDVAAHTAEPMTAEEVAR